VLPVATIDYFNTFFDATATDTLDTFFAAGFVSSVAEIDALAAFFAATDALGAFFALAMTNNLDTIFAAAFVSSFAISDALEAFLVEPFYVFLASVSLVFAPAVLFLVSIIFIFSFLWIEQLEFTVCVNCSTARIHVPTTRWVTYIWEILQDVIAKAIYVQRQISFVLQLKCVCVMRLGKYGTRLAVQDSGTFNNKFDIM
jgi:hypothetical protein